MGILFFNLKILEEQSCNNPKDFVSMLRYHYTKEIPRSKYASKPSKVNLQGDSYLLNPQDLFDDKNTDILYVVQYIKLAGRRDFMMYKEYGYKALNRSYYPDLLYDNIKHNSLLKITDKEVLFKYEELK